MGPNLPQSIARAPARYFSLWHYDNVTLGNYDIVALGHYNSVTLGQHHSVTQGHFKTGISPPGTIVV